MGVSLSVPFEVLPLRGTSGYRKRAGLAPLALLLVAEDYPDFESPLSPFEARSLGSPQGPKDLSYRGEGLEATRMNLKQWLNPSRITLHADSGRARPHKLRPTPR
ncbi:MAG TPA: hypothetical protein DCP28_10445 [Cytophagales bacterium]|nr:hypothetical protein [Cytophagales bacterium]